MMNNLVIGVDIGGTRTKSGLVNCFTGEVLHSIIQPTEAAGGHVLTVEEPEATENESLLSNIIPFNFMACYLSLKLNVKETFVVGGKITEVVL